MRILFYACLRSGLLFTHAGCNDKSEKDEATVDAQPLPSTQPVAKAPDVCALLTREEIEAVQRSPIKDMTSSVRADGGLRVAQCFYTAREYSKSVVLSTTEGDSSQKSPKRNLKELWSKTFHRDFTNEREEDKEEAGEEEDEWPPAKKISGLGDEAYWSRGSLYILTKDSFIRIAIGGPEPEETKIQRLKTLAEKAIPRL